MSQTLTEFSQSTSRLVTFLFPHVGTAVPDRKISQAEVLDFFLSLPSLKESTKALYGRVLRHPSISNRYFSIRQLDDVLEADLGAINRRFEVDSRRLATLSLERAILKNGLHPSNIDILVTTTCTGYLCPGLSSYLLESIPLKASTQVFDLVGMGCGAAIPAIHLAESLVQKKSGLVAAVVCCEICSAAFYSDDTPEAVISNSLFSDGAAAMIISSRMPQDAPSLSGDSFLIKDFNSITEPQWREDLRFKNIQGFLKNVLSVGVPSQVGSLTRKCVSTLLDRWGLSVPDVGFWAIHPGGDKVLSAVQKELALLSEKLDPSRWVLKNYGNMSSPSVLFVLDRIFNMEPAASPEWGVLLSYGAGFSVHAALVQRLT